ncbi:hypothetical protein SC09_Contig17orf00112 [Bacillus subtilis]|uniref:Uncharacterized protein n=1 Tax=Bacillus subtilis TaxID=1423 RepID=A0A0D1IUI2_BACIU|nr:hypothetical protein SC09_Contig17orf00112 [Bacillus subtilis]
MKIMLELMVYFIYSSHVYHPLSLLDKPLTRIFRNFIVRVEIIC